MIYDLKLKNPDIQELLSMGWGLWNKYPDENGDVLILCPLKEIHDIPWGTEVECIDGKRLIVGIDRLDMTTRHGLLPFGVRC